MQKMLFDTGVFCPGMSVSWIEQVPANGETLLTPEQITESTRDRKKEVSMASARIFSSNAYELSRLKKLYGQGPFKVLKVISEPGREADHCQHIVIETPHGPLKISGFWVNATP